MPEDLTGQKFGRLRVVSLSRIERSRRFWFCVCDCGNGLTVRSDGLKCGDYVSCGCKKVDQLTTHGATGTPEHKVWCSMIERCYTPTHQSYRHYGERGIKVCDRWRDFEAFLSDMGVRPSAAHTLERTNNDQGYFPSNCKWATRSEQARNRRTTKLNAVAVATIRAASFRVPNSVLANRFGIDQSNISRVRRGKAWRGVS